MTNNDIQLIIDNGGATLNKNGAEVSFKSGYQVSIRDCFILNVDNIEQITDSINAVLLNLKRGEFCGLWVNGEKIYVDVSVRILERKKAFYVGRNFKQIAIFDWATGKCPKCALKIKKSNKARA